MLRHIVLWNLNDDCEKKEAASKIKTILEALKNSIDEAVEIKVHINELSSSNTDIMLDSLFENEAALNAYKIHPEHIKAGEFIASVTKNRAAFDFFE
jgi:hypothetical protein